MSDCLTYAGKNLANKCVKVKGGNKTKAWLILKDELVTATPDITNPSKITDIVLEAGKVAFVVDVNFKGIDTGFDFVRGADGFSDGYTGFASVKLFEKDVASMEDLDALDNVLLIVEDRDKAISDDGVFRMYGFENGLWKSSDTSRANSERGTRLLELTNREEEEETYSRYNFWSTDYDGSLTALEALETAV